MLIINVLALLNVNTSGTEVMRYIIVVFQNKISIFVE